MTKLKPLFQSSLIILLFTGCKPNIVDVELQSLTVTILEDFTKKEKSYLDTLAKYNQSVFYLLDISREGGKTRLQCYLIENRFDDYVDDFKAHSEFNGYDVVIYGGLDPLFYNLKDSKETSYVHKYGSSENYTYDPPYWNLYFDSKGNLIKTSPKEAYDNLDIPKAK